MIRSRAACLYCVESSFGVLGSYKFGLPHASQILQMRTTSCASIKPYVFLSFPVHLINNCDPWGVGGDINITRSPTLGCEAHFRVRKIIEADCDR